MMALGFEYATIGTNFSEDTENWNLRDMVSEMKYFLDLYNEDGTCYSDMKEDCYDEWRHDVKLMQGFISKYKDEALKIKGYTRHCSCYD